MVYEFNKELYGHQAILTLKYKEKFENVTNTLS